MESYFELTFIHNFFIHSFALTLSTIYSKKRLSKQKFIFIIFMTTLLPSILFINYHSTMIWINEILIFICFKYYISTYLFYVGFRIMFIIFYYFLFNGTIFNHQFFLFDHYSLYFDLILSIVYISVLMKWKYVIHEKEYLYEFILDNKKYIGYLDTGNNATYNQIPIIFIKDNIFNSLNYHKETIDIETINGFHTIEIIKKEIILNTNKIIVYCSKLNEDFEYDALLNMKGTL